MSWKDTIKDAIFEEEPDSKKPEPVKPIHPQTQIPVPAAFQTDPFANVAAVQVPTMSINESADPDSISVFADRLKAKTDFDATPVGQQVNEHLAPLDGLPLTEMQK